MYLSVILDICTSPSSCKPISINAPKSTTFLTVPDNSIPTFKSSILRMSLFNRGLSKSSLKSLLGLEKHLIISSKV